MTSSPQDYLARVPGGLRRALVSGQWLPVVGAGISSTAATDDGRHPPQWSQLGDRLAEDLSVPTSGNPIEAISAFADLYGRPALVERLHELLLIDEADPSDVHRAFARLPFDVVVTTNADLLLERAYQQERRPCLPLIGESQLPLGRGADATVRLLKFHGDVRHPEELVMTEEDYDGFLRRRPLLGTYISWLLLTREPVLLGYSLNDGDVRDVLALLRERLGRMTRAGWAILPMDPGRTESGRFTRRGLRPIVLDERYEDTDPDRGAAHRSFVMQRFFEQLRAEWDRRVIPRITARTDAMTAELRRA